MSLLKDGMIRIQRSPMRSILVTLTFALGFSAVVAIVGTIEGGRRAIGNDLEALGSDLLALVNPVELGTVSLGRVTEGSPVTSQDIPSIKTALGSEVETISPLLVNLGLTTYGEISWRHTMVATTPGFLSVLRSGMLAGRFLEESDRWPDDREGIVPAAIDEALALKFFTSAEYAMGRRFRSIRSGIPFTCEIIGVVGDPLLLRQHLSSFDATSRARSIPARRLEFLNLYMPWREGIDQPTVTILDVDTVDKVDGVKSRLDQWVEDNDKGVYLHVQKQWTAIILQMVDRFSGLGHFIWVLGLTIVLILTATISLLAIDESMEEVALRRAEGARVSQVITPVFLEAGMLSLLALFPGYWVGLSIIEWGVKPVLGWEAWLPLEMILGVSSARVVTAMLSAVLPAYRVATLDPAPVLCGRRDI